MVDLHNIWKNALEFIENKTNAISYDVWIKTMEPVAVIDNRLVLMASSAIAKTTIQKNYLSILAAAVNHAHATLTSVEIIEPAERDNVISGAISADEPVAVAVAPEEAETEEVMQFNPKYTFSNFVVGGSNQFADAAARSVAANPGVKHNPLFIYGGVGLGKTHMMHAIGNQLKKEKSNLKVVYVSSDKFTNELIGAIFSGHERGLNQAFRERYRNVDVLMIDDVQFIANKPSVQEEIFHTFNDLYQQNKQIIISSDRPPKEIAPLEERLRSRFEWGLIADIQPPDFITRMAILKKKAQLENYNISDDILEYLCERINTNIREMEGSLTRVYYFASLLERPLTLDVAKEALRDYFTETQESLSADTIIDAVCRYCRVTKDDLVGKKRNKEIVEPRQVCMYLITDMLSLPLTTIGQIFGGRDHTTVMNARDKVSARLKTSNSIKADIENIKNLIKKR